MPIETGVSNILQTYVTISQLGDYLPLAGGTMLGQIQMQNNFLRFAGSGYTATRIWGSSVDGTLYFRDAFNNTKTLSDLNSFINKLDTPSVYTGAGNKLVAVNSGATALEFVDQSILSPPGHLTPAITRYEMPGWCCDTAGSTANLASGVIYYIPFFVAETTTYIDINVENTASFQTGSVDCRIYNWNGGIPGSQILNVGTFSWSGELATTKTITINQSLNRGFYFMAFRLASGTIDLYEVNKNGTVPVGGMKGVGTPTPAPSNIVTMTKTAALADPAPAPDGMTDKTFIFLMKTHA